MTHENHQLLHDEMRGLIDNLDHKLAIPSSEASGYYGYINNRGDRLAFATQHNYNRLARCAIYIQDNELDHERRIELTRHPSKKDAWQYGQRHSLNSHVTKKQLLNSTDVIGIISSHIDETPGFMKSVLDEGNNGRREVADVVTNIADEFGLERRFHEKNWKSHKLLNPEDPLSSYNVHLSNHETPSGSQIELAISAPLSLTDNPGFFESIRQAYVVRYKAGSESAVIGEAQYQISPNAPITDPNIIRKMEDAFYYRRQFDNSSSVSEDNLLIFSKGLAEVSKYQTYEIDDL
jgi:hypothetical protein